MRLIDADALIAKFKDDLENLQELAFQLATIGAINTVKHQPTIDAVPVVRCKDCKYYRDGDCWHEWDNDGRIYYQSVINEPNPDDYCSRAERKQE